MTDKDNIDKQQEDQEEKKDIDIVETPVKEEVKEEEPVKEEKQEDREDKQQGEQAGKEASIEINTKAIIEWDDGSTEEHYRSRLALGQKMANILDTVPEKADQHVKIYLLAHEGDKQVQQIIAQGTGKEVKETLDSNSMTPQTAMMQLDYAVGLLFELSGLKGIVLTTVFEDAGIGGFGRMSDAVEVADGDKIMLGSAAESQADMFKDAMREQGLTFPDDSPLILPGQNNNGMHVVSGGNE